MVKQFDLRVTSPKTKMATNFILSEFQCRDKNPVLLISLDIIIIVQKIRDYYKKPVNIHSAYRTETYNAKVGGAPKTRWSQGSRHMYGNALDISVAGVPVKELAKVAKQCGAKGIGIYISKGFVHIDDWKVRTWTEK